MQLLHIASGAMNISAQLGLYMTEFNIWNLDIDFRSAQTTLDMKMVARCMVMTDYMTYRLQEISS